MMVQVGRVFDQKGVSAILSVAIDILDTGTWSQQDPLR